MRVGRRPSAGAARALPQRTSPYMVPSSRRMARISALAARYLALALASSPSGRIFWPRGPRDEL